MATTNPRRSGWPLSAFPSTSSVTFRNALIFVSLSMTVYTMIALMGVVDTFKPQHLVTYSQSLVSYPSSSFILRQNYRKEGIDGHTNNNIISQCPPPPHPPSDELSDFHIYNVSKNPETTKTWPRPQLHVLVDVRNPSSHGRRDLCRTLLSTVIQGYPPPILVGYRSPDSDQDKKNEDDNQVSSTESFLKAALDTMQYIKLLSSGGSDKHKGEEGGGDGGKRNDQVQDQESIVLFLRRNQWIQMPAEVTVRRYLQHKDVWSQRLARVYDSQTMEMEAKVGGTEEGNRGEKQAEKTRNHKYRLGVLFPASRRKTCATWDRVCAFGTRGGDFIGGPLTSGTQERKGKNYFDEVDDQDNILPESSLPRDIYGVFPNDGTVTARSISSTKKQTGKYNDGDTSQNPLIPTQYRRPPYLGGGSFIGSAEDVERLFRGALERLSWLQPETGKVKGHSQKGEDAGASGIDNGDDVDKTTYLFSEIFFEQEIERRIMHQGSQSTSRQDTGDTSTRRKRWWQWSIQKAWIAPPFLGWLGHPVKEEKDDTPASTPDPSAARQYRHSGNTTDTEYEFGIGLDYESRIFQDMFQDMGYEDDKDDSTNNKNSSTAVQITHDIRFLPYDAPTLVRSPSRSAAHLFQQPLMLPPELLHPLSPNGTSSPFGPNSAIYNNLGSILEEARKVKISPSADDIEQEKRREQEKKTKRDQETNSDSEEEGERIEKLRTNTIRIPWSSLEFTTNVVVPRGSIPSVLDMSRFAVATKRKEEGEKKDDINEAATEPREIGQQILDEYWNKMWFNQKKHRQPPEKQRQQDQHQERSAADDNDKTTTAERLAQEEEPVAPAKVALLDEYIKPNPFIYNLESEAWAGGGENNNWWNVRGGRGGFWTDQGAWVPWKDICGDVEM